MTKTMKNLTLAASVWLLLTTFVIAQDPTKNVAGRQARLISRGLAQIAANGADSLLNPEFDSQSLPQPLRRWLESHQHTVVGVTASPFTERLSWGSATTFENKLFLLVTAWPKDNLLVVPRLHNSVVSVKLIGSEDDLKLTPNVADWSIALPEKPKRNILPVIEMELDSRAKLGSSEPPIVRSDDKNEIALHARYAVTHGEMLRFEPQPHKNTVGYWVKENDWVVWNCSTKKLGTYEVTLRYGCGNGQGGSDIEIAIGDNTLPFQVAATGGFQAWRDVVVGTVALPADKTIQVSVKPKTKAKNAVMDIQQITLRQVD